MDIVFILFLSFFLFSILYWTLKVGISPMFSSIKATKFISKQVIKNNSDTIVDLGSGWGSLALYIAIKNPKKQVIGYELSFFPYYLSKLLIILFRLKNLKFYRKDFFQIEFFEDNLYITYLYPKGMEKLEQKIKDENRKIKLISNTFAFSYLEYSKVTTLNDFFKTPIYFYNL